MKALPASKQLTPQEFYFKFPRPGFDREAALVRQALAHNYPARWLKAVKVQDDSVSPDYFMLGTDENFVRTPMTPFAAQFLGDEWGLEFPTKELVDAIWIAAPTKLAPRPEQWWDWKRFPTEAPRFGANYLAHNRTIERQRMAKEGLIAGHKKDLIAHAVAERVHLYGWHYPNGSAIQRPSVTHDQTYEDYSHGARFCAPSLRTGRVFDGPYPVEFLLALRSET